MTFEFFNLEFNFLSKFLVKKTEITIDEIITLFFALEFAKVESCSMRLLPEANSLRKMRQSS